MHYIKITKQQTVEMKSKFSDDFSFYPAGNKKSMIFKKRIIKRKCSYLLLKIYNPTCSENTSIFALIFCFITVVISTTASIPKLCTGIRLLVVVPVDAIVSAGALVQAEVTAGTEKKGL